VNKDWYIYIYIYYEIGQWIRDENNTAQQQAAAQIASSAAGGEAAVRGRFAFVQFAKMSPIAMTTYDCNRLHGSREGGWIGGWNSGGGLETARRPVPVDANHNLTTERRRVCICSYNIGGGGRNTQQHHHRMSLCNLLVQIERIFKGPNYAVPFNSSKRCDT